MMWWCCVQHVRRSVKAVQYDTHFCTEEVNKEEMQLVTSDVHKMLGSSKENCIHIPTGGTVSDKYFLYSKSYLQPLMLAHVTKPKAPITELSKRTRKCHVLELRRMRSILTLWMPRAYLCTWYFVLKYTVLISHLNLHASFWSSDHCS